MTNDTIEVIQERLKMLREHELLCAGECRVLEILVEEIEQQYIKLPLDADGVHIKPGDYMALGDSRGEVIALTYTPGNSLPWEMQLDDGEWYSTQFAHHVQHETVESVLSDFAIACEEQGYKDPHIDGLLEEYAERIRKAVEHDR